MAEHGPLSPSSQAGSRASRGGLPSSPSLFMEALHAVTLLEGSTVPSPSFGVLRAVEVLEVMGDPPCCDRSKSLNRSAEAWREGSCYNMLPEMSSFQQEYEHAKKQGV